MSTHSALGWLAVALFAASAGCGYAAWRSQREALELWQRHVAVLERELRFQSSAWTGASVARLQLVLGLSLIAMAALRAAPLPLAGAFLVAIAPSFVLGKRRLRRTEQMERQLDGFLIALAHSLRATPALGDGLRSSAEVVARPLADELHVLLREQDLGTPIDRALENMAQRVQSPVVSAALSTLRIARSTGGDFVHTLERSAATLREMARLEGVVRTKTAEGRAQTVVVSVLPVPILMLIDRLSPELLEPLWTTDTGHVVIAAAVLLWLIAIVAARRLAHVDI